MGRRQGWGSPDGEQESGEAEEFRLELSQESRSVARRESPQDTETLPEEAQLQGNPREAGAFSAKRK